MGGLAVDARQGEDAAQCGPDARRPGDREGGARDDRPAFAGRSISASTRHSRLRLVDEDRRDEEDAHHDQEHRADVGQRVLVLAQRAAELGSGQAEQDEDGRERGDKEKAGDQDPAPVRIADLAGLTPVITER